MGILLRYIRKNMAEKKGRLVLVVLSIALSTGLLVACLGLWTTIEDSFTEPSRKATEGREVMLRAADQVWFTEQDFTNTGLTDLTGEIALTGVTERNDELGYVSIHGRTAYDGAMKSGFFSDWKEAGCILSERIAKELSLNEGDSLSLRVNGIPVELKVRGIAVNDGLFYSDAADEFSVIVSYSWLNETLGADGKYNVMYAKVPADGNKTADEDTVKEAVNKFNDANSSVAAYSRIGLVVIADSSLTMSVAMMFGIVVVVSVIIISGVFKLIISERLTTFGTFLSQGATKGQVSRIVLLESAVYACIAGILGCALGEGVLWFVGRMISPLKDYGIYLPFEISWTGILFGMVFAIVMSVTAAWLPVRKIKKLPVKEVILNQLDHKHKKKVASAIAGFVLLAAGIIGNRATAGTYSAMAVFNITAAYIGVILLAPAVIRAVMGVLCKLFRPNTTMWLACNNIRTSKLLISNIVLLIISLDAIFSVSSTGVTMTKVVEDAYQEFVYDYDVSHILPGSTEESASELLYQELAKNEHIDRESLCAVIYDIGKAGNDQDTLLIATDPEPFAESNLYLKLKQEPYKEGYRKFAENEDTVVITKSLARNMDLKKDDDITITLGGVKHTYHITGIIDGGLYNGGAFVLMKRSDLAEIHHSGDFSSLYFNIVGDAKAAEASFKDIIKSYGATYASRAEETKANVEQNAMIVSLIGIFSYLAIGIASIGIFNNIVICFAQRRREFAVMASVGMNGKGRRRLILCESMLCVLIGVIIAVPFTLLVNRLITGMLYFLGIPFDILFDWKGTPLYLAVFTAIVFLASLSTMRKSRKLSVVAELKYE